MRMFFRMAYLLKIECSDTQQNFVDVIDWSHMANFSFLIFVTYFGTW